MYCISVAYPGKDGAKFDFDYYAKKHIPMVTRHLGPNTVKAEIRKGVASPDGSAASFIRPEIMGDIPHYTNIQPILQVDEVVG